MITSRYIWSPVLPLFQGSSHRSLFSSLCGGVNAITRSAMSTIPPVDKAAEGLYTDDGRRVVTLIKGDGIGPEIAMSVVQIADAAKVPIAWEYVDIYPVIKKGTTEIPQDAIDSINKTKLALKGPLQTPIGSGHRSMNLTLRKTFDLYANYRAARSIKGVNTPFKDVDIMVIRENTEGEYSGVEHVIYKGIVQSIKIITEKASRKCIKFSFDMARASGRKNVLIVHKASIQRLTDGLFLAVGNDVAKEYPDISISDLNIDTACLKIVSYPQTFSDTVMVMPNLYGDIVTDLCSGLVGGLGLTGSGNIGTNVSIFESVHGSAPDIAGKGLANPTALLMSFILLLRRAGMNSYANVVEKAVLDVISEGKVITRDVGGTATCSQYTKHVIAHIKNS